MSTRHDTWIDMTDLSIWKGHFTGIQRVVYNIAREYHLNGKANYFYFDEKNRNFYEFDFENFESSLTSSLETPQTQAVSRKEKTIIVAKNIYQRSPNTIKRIIKPHTAKRLAKKGLTIYSNINSKRPRLNIPDRSRTVDSRKKIVFSDNANVIILGNSWDRPNLLMTLSALKRKSSFKLFQVVYDLIPVFQPQAFNEELFNIYSNNMFEVATVSDGLMAISESSKRDMEKFCKILNIDCPPIKVIRLGDDIPVSNKLEKPSVVDADKKFVLCVGTIEARKNHTILYYAWKEGIARGYEMPNLVIVGRPGWYTGDVVHVFKNDPEMINKVTILQNVNDDQLVWLYENCQYTIYPSYYEGWGLPVAESLAMGKFCLSSNASSMPEIGGDIIEYFSPFDSSQLCELIQKYSQKALLISAEKKITREYSVVKWHETYKQVFNFISKKYL